MFKGNPTSPKLKNFKVTVNIDNRRRSLDLMGHDLLNGGTKKAPALGLLINLKPFKALTYNSPSSESVECYVNQEAGDWFSDPDSIRT